MRQRSLWQRLDRTSKKVCTRLMSERRPVLVSERESLEGLSCESITRVLSHSYKSIVPIAPLSGDPLPLNAADASPLFFGPTGDVASLWFQLACYAHLGAGPVSHLFLRGQVPLDRLSVPS